MNSDKSKQLPVYLKKHPKGTTIQIYVQPNAKKTQIIGLHDGALKIKLDAPPVDGEANLCLITWLKDSLSVSKQKIELLSGLQSRRKVVLIVGLSPEEITKALGQ